MTYGQITPQYSTQFVAIVGAGNMFLDDEHVTICASDETEDHVFMPHVVLTPSTAEEIGAVLHICNQHVIPGTPRGGWSTSLSGG